MEMRLPLALLERFHMATKNYFHQTFSNFQDNPVLKGAAHISKPLLWPREKQELLVYTENELTDIIHHLSLVRMSDYRLCQF